MRRWAVTLCGGMGALGCTDKESPPPLDTIDPPETTPPIETALEGGYVDAAYFLVMARFAYDPDLGMHVGFAEPGEGLSPMQLSVLFLDSPVATNGVTPDNSCEVTLEIEAPQGQAPWVEAAGAFTGFDVPGDSRVRDRCRGYRLPGDFQGEVGSHVAKWRWGIGVGELDEVVEEQLRQTLPASEWATLEDYILGAVGSSNLFASGGVGTPEGLTTQGYGTAFEVDGNFEISVSGTGNPLPIPAANIDQEVGVARAFYEVQLGPFEPGTFLATEPQ